MEANQVVTVLAISWWVKFVNYSHLYDLFPMLTLAAAVRTAIGCCFAINTKEGVVALLILKELLHCCCYYCNYRVFNEL